MHPDKAGPTQTDLCLQGFSCSKQLLLQHVKKYHNTDTEWFMLRAKPRQQEWQLTHVNDISCYSAGRNYHTKSLTRVVRVCPGRTEDQYYQFWTCKHKYNRTIFNINIISLLFSLSYFYHHQWKILLFPLYFSEW